MTVRDKGVQTFNSIRENNRDCRRTAESGHEETLSCSWEESVQAEAGIKSRRRWRARSLPTAMAKVIR